MVLDCRRLVSFASGLVALIVPGFAAAEEQFTVIKAGRVITVSGDEYRNGMVVIVDGKIRLVGTNLEYPAGAEVIEAPRETVMPGFVHARSRYRLPRYSRSGNQSNQDTTPEVYPSEVPFEEFLSQGFTAVAFYPAGSGLPGAASVYRTGGEEGPQALRDRSYLRVTMTSPSQHKGVLRGALSSAQKAQAKIDKARKAWEKKQEARRKKESEAKKKDKDPKASGDGSKKDGVPAKVEKFQPPPVPASIEPLMAWLEGDEAVFACFEIRNASDLLHLDQVLSDYDELSAARFYLAGGFRSDLGLVVEELGRREAHVLMVPRLAQILHTINRQNLAADLSRAGCQVSFVPPFDGVVEFGYLRTRVAMLVRAGLEREAALAALTLHPAELLGVDDRVGSLEKGKDADLVFLSGDPLDPGSEVTRVMIQGALEWEDEQ